ncbi:transcriptional activatory protein AadR [mine drainage metagenome]|uniref:Transcriptional activatory protein AadR n=1 Tax=mine drainage metagenome TaxID=410659 RepID=A0A1J5PJZ2_9ZZZZ
MKATLPCVTCPHRDRGFCGALLEKRFEESHSHQDANWQHFRTVPAGEQIVARNQLSEDVFVLCGGWAFRFFPLPDGRRQILNFLLPGDLFSVTSVFEERFHFSVKALTEIQISRMRRTEVQSRLAVNPRILTALAKSCVAEFEAADEMQAALGQYSAEERIANLFLHLMQRLAARSVIREQRYPFPLRQQVIADAVGLTPVHVSRVLSLFRERGIVELSDGLLKVFNLPELERIGALN